jgi:hypothetical protein
LLDTALDINETVGGDTFVCVRCATRRPRQEMDKLTIGWACNTHLGVTCAMQLIYRGYGSE